MDLGQIIKYAPAVLEGVAVVTGTILLVEYDDEIFDKIKYSTGQIIEGIVIRSKYSNNLSVKYINPEYDSKS